MGSGASSGTKASREGTPAKDEEVGADGGCTQETTSEFGTSGAGKPKSNPPRNSSSGKSRTRDAKIKPYNESDASSYEELQRCRLALTESQEQTIQAQTQAKELETQMAKLEGSNLDLQEQVSCLEEQLDDLKQSQLIHQEASDRQELSNTVKAKDHYISKLEQETQTVQGQIAKLKIKYKKRVCALTTQLCEAKQGNSLQRFELKDEISQLSEENNSLLGQIRTAPSTVTMAPSPAEGSTEGDYSHRLEPDHRRNQIILNLSSKVSEQDENLRQLELKLAEKDRLIEKLMADAKLSENGYAGGRASTATVWASVSDESLLKVEQTDGISEEVISKCGTQMDVHSKDLKATSELQEIAREMQKMSKKKRKKAPQRVKRKEQEKDLNGSDIRQSSSISRDSGIVAGVGDAQCGAVDTIGSAPRGLSDWDDVEDDQDAAGVVSSKPSSAVSRNSYFSSDLSDSECPPTSPQQPASQQLPRQLDPSSIRRISASKKRHAKHDTSHDVSAALSSACIGGDSVTSPEISKRITVKPPVGKPRSNKLNEEADELIHSIDEDFLAINAFSSPAKMSHVSVS